MCKWFCLLLVYPMSAQNPGPTTSGALASSNPTWQSLTMPASCATATFGCRIDAGQGDQNIYVHSETGAAPTATTTISHATIANAISGTWTTLPTITSANCTNCGSEVFEIVGVSNNGTIFTAGFPFADVLFYTGTTWTPIAGYCGGTGCTTGSTSIYKFAFDSSGKMYFSPAGSGTIWGSTAANGTTFSTTATNVYALAACGSLTSGRLFNMLIVPSPTIGFAGDNFITGGEGSLLIADITWSNCTGNTYIPTGTGAGKYTGNLTATAYDPSGNSGQGNILAVRTAQAATLNDLTDINVTTGVQTLHTCPQPRTTNSCVAANNGTGFSGMGYLHNHIFSWSAQETSSGTIYLLESADGGATWQDITPGISANCTGANLGLNDVQSYQLPNYIITKCQNGQFGAIYGPV